MNSTDFPRIEEYLDKDPMLRRLYEEHKQLKRQIAKLEKKPFLTAAEQRDETRLKKLKLAGKDRIVRILEKYRNG